MRWERRHWEADREGGRSRKKQEGSGQEWKREAGKARGGK